MFLGFIGLFLEDFFAGFDEMSLMVAE